MKRRNFLTLFLLPLLPIFGRKDPLALERKLPWGTYGKDGRQPLKWVRLGDCSTEHLQAIYHYRRQHVATNDRYQKAITALLKERGHGVGC